MSTRHTLFGLLVVALVSFGATAQAQQFGEEESSESEESESSEAQTGESESSSESESSGSMGSETSTSTASSSSSSGMSSGSTETSSGANGLDSGAMSLSFTVPAGGNPYADGAAGVWYMVTGNINLGINLGLGIESQEVIEGYNSDDEESTQSTGFDLLLAPGIRYYLLEDSSVAPYILGQLYFQKFFDGNDETTGDPDEVYDRRTDNDTDNDDIRYNSDLQPRFGLIGGFGLEWFPVEQFSIGGHIGLGFDLVRPNEFQFNGENNSTLTTRGPRIGTLTSALKANIYF